MFFCLRASKGSDVENSLGWEREKRGKAKPNAFFSSHLPFTPKKERVIATFTAEGNATIA